MVESLPRRSVPGPYEGPVEPDDLQSWGYLRAAACHCSLGYTRGVPIEVCTFPRVVSVRGGGYDQGLCRLRCIDRCPVSDSLGFVVSLPRLALTTLLRSYCPRVGGSVFPG